MKEEFKQLFETIEKAIRLQIKENEVIESELIKRGSEYAMRYEGQGQGLADALKTVRQEFNKI